MTGVTGAAGLALRLLRLGGRGARTSAGLVAAGVAVATALLCVALGALHGLDERQERTSWREPARAASPADAVALLRTRGDVVAGRPVTEVNLVAPRPGAAPPPGLPRMPAPGEVWMSPAMTRLTASLPPSDLADRYPGPVTGTLGDAGLRDPGELVVVVGRPAGDPVLTAPGTSEVVPVAGFDRPAPAPGRLDVYRQLTTVAAVLMVFPAAGLVGASARLSATRRRERLATVRLLGASTAQVTVVAVTEVTVAVLLGAVGGVLLEQLAAPALAAIPLDGGGWYAADLRPSPTVLLAVLAGITVLATLSAVGGLRRVVVSPLGVRRRQEPHGVRAVRVLALLAAVLVAAVVNGSVRSSPTATAGLVFAVAVLALFGAVVLIGPLVVRLVGAVLVRRRGVHRLLAGRRLLDDPRGAFRPLAGLTLAVFVTAFVAPLTASVAGYQNGRDDLVTLPVSAARAEQAAAAARARLGPEATVTVQARPADSDQGVPVPRGYVALTVAALPVAHDRVRTALDRAVPGTLALSPADSAIDDTLLTGDLTRGALVVLVATFLLAATASGTAAAARVLDHRHELHLQRLAGTPLPVLDRARRAETLAPLLACGGIALALGVFCASPFAAAGNAFSPSGLIVFGVLLVAGTLVVAGATAASRPLLASVTAPGRERDR